MKIKITISKGTEEGIQVVLDQDLAALFAALGAAKVTATLDAPTPPPEKAKRGRPAGGDLRAKLFDMFKTRGMDEHLSREFVHLNTGREDTKELDRKAFTDMIAELETLLDSQAVKAWCEFKKTSATLKSTPSDEAPPPETKATGTLSIDDDRGF